MKIVYSQQMFEESSNIKCLQNPYSGRRVIPYGRTNRHDEGNIRFSQFCQHA